MADPAELIRRHEGLCDLIADWMDGKSGPSPMHRQYAIELAGRIGVYLAAPSPAPTVPEGWQLVPTMPTEAMLRKVFSTSIGNVKLRHKRHDAKTYATWFAMLLASPPAPVSEGWRDIASAPKDGTWVLLCQDQMVAIAKRVSDVGETLIASKKPYWEKYDHSYWDVYGAEGIYDPTHWMPLPAPPAAPEAGR